MTSERQRPNSEKVALALALQQQATHSLVFRFTQPGKAQIPLGSLRRDMTRHVSRVSRRACRAVLFDKLDTAKMHEPDTSNVSSYVET